MSLQELDAATLETLVEQSSATPLLLDVWAPWCAPCRAQAPALSRLAGATEGILRVAKLNTDDHKPVAESLKIRGIPTLILFKDGKELSRRTGVQTLQKLQVWLASEEVDLQAAGLPGQNDEDGPPLGGAFYGDTELRTFLCDRVLKAAQEGRLKPARFPHWSEGEGTISAAFGQSANPELFERLTGIPAGFGVCLEAPFIDAAANVERILSLLPTGADLRMAPARYMAQWLDDSAWNWPELLGAEVDALRMAWLDACRDSLAGKTVSREAWNALKSQAESLERPDPLWCVQTHFAEMVAALSPLPASDDASPWGRALLLIGTYLVISRAHFEAGWRARDFSAELVRLNWYKAHCPNPQNLTAEEMKALHARQREANRELMDEVEPKEEAFNARREELIAPWWERLMTHLLNAMR